MTNPIEPPINTIKLRQKTDTEKIGWIINQLVLFEFQGRTREEKLDMILNQQDEILVRLRRLDT